MNILGRSGFTELSGDKYSECTICGTQTYRVVVHFDSGSVTPTVGETVTGATSADTGVIEFVQLTDGTYAGSNAAGVIILTSPTGYDSDTSRIFSDNEHLNGSVSGADFADVTGSPGINRSGRLHPDWNLITYRGVKYCREHFRFRFVREWEDESKINISESERGK